MEWWIVETVGLAHFTELDQWPTEVKRPAPMSMLTLGNMMRAIDRMRYGR